MTNLENDCVIKISGLKKEYRLGVIGSTTLRHTIQSKIAKIEGKEDPNVKIGKASYSKKDTFLALDSVNLSVNRGERLGIIGANGAGKSTLLKILSRVTSPTEGEIMFRGRIASMLEVGTGFHGELTGRENIYLNGAILGMSKSEIASKIDKIIEFSECEKFIDTPVKRYSSGMFVKLAFAVASHLDAEIMIMDEVLAVGDMAFQKKCIEKMRNLATDENRTVLYVSHNMNTIRNLCNRCIVLEHGKIIFDGDVDKAIEIYLGSDNQNFFSFDYDSYIRHEELKRNEAKILSAKYVGKTDNIFYDNEPLQLEVKLKALEKVNNLCLRVAFLDTRRNPVTSCLLENFYSGEKGSVCKKKLSLDISHLANGGYYTQYIIYNRKDETAPFEEIDIVPGLSVRKRQREIHQNKWKRAWGSIISEDIKIIE